MIELTRNNDPRNSKTLRLNQLDKDAGAHWDVNFTTNNLPTAFENSNANNQQIKLSVIEGSDFDPSTTPNSFLIPLVLIGMSNIDGKTVCFYRSRHESDDDTLLRAKISASITLEEGMERGATDPHLLMVFDTVKQNSGDNASANTHEFTSGKPTEPYVIRTQGESAMGGAEIPLDQVDQSLKPMDKVVMPA
jgi:hypothetical protein